MELFWFICSIVFMLLLASSVYGYKKGRRSIFRILEKIDSNMVDKVKQRETDEDPGEPPYKNTGFYNNF